MLHRSIRRNVVSILALEPRLMFDGAAVAAAADQGSGAPAQHAADAAADSAAANGGTAGDAPAQSAAEATVAAASVQDQPAQPAAPREVAFVDAHVQDVETLLAGLHDGVEVVMLDPAGDELAQIADWARSHAGYDAIHVFGHGQDGTLLLGSLSLTAESVGDHAADLAAIGAALTVDGDLLFYGCDSGAGTAGQALADALAAAAGADVALSGDLTGAAARGGDWVLETQAGNIEAVLPLLPEAMDAYRGVLAIYSGTINFDSDGGSVTDAGDTDFDGVGTATYSIGGYTLTGVVTGDGSVIVDADGLDGDNEFTLGSSSAGAAYTAFKFTNDEYFDLSSLRLTNFSGMTSQWTITGKANGSVVATHVVSSLADLGATDVTLTGFTGINLVEFTLDTGAKTLGLDNIVIANLGYTPGPSAPTVTDGNIAISGGSGTGGAFKIGDTVTATWNNTAGGDNNAGITGVTVDFSQFGGGAAVAASNASGTWTATYVITAGAIDATNRNVSVTATNATGPTTTADTTNATVDSQAPTVTDGNIAISGGSGTGGAFKIGDTVTATWNNTAGGDNNADTISGVTVDFSAFGGGSAVAATNSSGTWTATYTITAGAIDATNRNVSVTATDNAGNTTTTADSTNATVDNQAPTVTDGNIAISGGSGTGGAFKIGDTVTATWNNTAGGDNNADTISGVTVDFSAFGGGSAVAATNASGTWTATYVITAGAIDATNRNVSVTATDNAGNTTTTADSTNATVDNQAPTVTDGNIAISGGSGTGGAFKIGDTVTATWNNTAGGDNNADISGVTVDFSQFGGGSAVAATNSSGTWTATYTITAGAIDATNRNVSVTATDNAGNTTTTADSTNATVDNQAPTVTDGNIAISGGSGTGGAFKIGDTVTATWNNTAGGDNNADTISGVTVDFSAFGGGSAVAATNASGTWTATYVITAGAIDASNRNVSVTATDNAGNTTTTADSTNATVDNQAPTVTDGNIAISGGSGTGGAFKIGDTVTATWNNTAGGDNNADISGVTVDFSQFGGGAAVAASNASGTWTATYTITAGAIDATNRNVSVTATDNAGNTTTTADSTNATIDSQAPTVTDGNIAISGGSGTGGAFKIGDTVTATWNNTAGGDNNADTISGVTVDFSAFGGGAAVAASNASGTWTATYVITAGAIDATNRNVSVTATDNAGNTTTTADSTNATVDNQAPTVTDGNIAISGGSGTGGAFKIGDTVTATWNNTAGGDNNADTISGVTVDFSQFGGGSAVAASNASGTWTATYVITAGAIDATNRNVSVTATDNAGNATTTADTTNATVDSQAPTLTGVTSSSANGAYNAGDTISIQVAFDEAVTVTGTPELALNSGGTATYASGSGTSTLTFSYVVQPGDTAADLDFSGTSALSGGTIVDAAGNTATLTLPSPGAAGSLGANKDIVIDTTVPTLTGVTSSSANGAYNAGDTISIQVAFDEAVTVTGTPELALNSGGTATYASGSGTSTLTFSYVVQPGDTAADLDFSGTSALSGGTIADAAGNAATLTLPSPGAAGSLGANRDIVIDTTAPAGVALSNSTVDVNATGSGGVTIGTLSATDSNAVTYSLAAGTGDTDNGKFSITGTTLTTTQALAAGTYSIRVQTTDVAGNDTFEVFSITVLDGPTVTSIVRAGGAGAAIPASASSVAFTVTFTQAVTGVDVSDFTLTTTGSATGTIGGVSGSGDTYTVTVTGISGDGTLRLDLNGSGTGIQNGSSVAILSGYNGGEVYTLDRTAPAVPSVPDMTAGSDNGTSSTDDVTSQTTPTFTGTADAGSSVSLYDSNGTTVLGTAVADGSGNWSITASALAEGAHTVFARATDASGNASSLSSGLAVVIDTLPPANVALSTSTLNTTATAAGGAMVGTLSATDSSTVTYSLASGTGDTDNAKFALSGSTLTTTQALAAGTYSIRIKATDAVGHDTFAVKTITVVAPTPASTNTVPVVQAPPDAPSAPPSVDPGSSALQTIVRETAPSDRPAGLETVVRASASGSGTTADSAAQPGFSSPTPASAPASFQVSPATRPADGGDALVAGTPISDTTFTEGSRIVVTIPTDAFAHTSSSAVVSLQAIQADGSALPSWLSFDSVTGTFEGRPPPSFAGELTVTVIARDSEGREAIQTFKIVVGRSDAVPAGQGEVPGRSGEAAGDGHRHAVIMPAGRPSLTEQLRSMSQEGRIAKQMALFAMRGGGKAA